MQVTRARPPTVNTLKKRADALVVELSRRHERRYSTRAGARASELLSRAAPARFVGKTPLARSHECVVCDKLLSPGNHDKNGVPVWWISDHAGFEQLKQDAVAWRSDMWRRVHACRGCCRL